jgi:hypothetical protein
LRALCAGSWAETQSREIDWSEWEEATVERFLQWIHNGSYSTAEPVTEQSIGKIPTPSGQTASCHQFPRRDARTPSKSESKALGNPIYIDSDSPSAILMAHAKVFVLAQYTNTEALEHFALERLWNVLHSIKPLSKNSRLIKGIISLVEYVYANTNALVNSEEPLRRIISTFCASLSLELQDQPEFHSLLHAGGDFVVDLWEKVAMVREDEQVRVKKFETLGAEKEKLQKECATLRNQMQEVVRDKEQIQCYNNFIMCTIQDCYYCRSKFS